MKKPFPSVIYVQFDENDSEPNSLLAWPDKESPDNGRVATYQLVEEYTKRSVSEFQRKGTKAWTR